MKTIYKYGLKVEDHATVTMPVGAEVLDIKLDPSSPPGYGALVLWAIVERGAPLVEHNFEIRGTGHPLGEVGSFLATVQDGPFVWHVFQGREAF